MLLSRVGALSLSFSIGCAGVFAPAPRSPVYAARGLCTPASGAPSGDAREESVGIARGVLATAFAVIANEHPEHHRQQIEHRRTPLQRFPRLTFPALVDPEPAGAGRSSSWFFPLILAEAQIGYLPAADIQAEVSFWLVRHRESVASDPWFDVTDCLVRQIDGSGEVYSATSDPKTLFPGAADLLGIALLDFPTFARGEDLRGVVFEVPTDLATRSADVHPGFYDLKVLPKMGALRDLSIATPGLAEIAASLREGDWHAAVQRTQSLTVASLGTATAVADLREIAARLERGHPAPNFTPELDDLSRDLERLARALERVPPAGASSQERAQRISAVELGLARVERTLRATLSSHHSLAPVALRDPAREPTRCGGDPCVRFAISGDMQYHGDVAPLLHFLERFDPDVVQPGSRELASPSEPTLDIDFVLLAGDVADSAASTQLGQLALNFIGVLPPSSPYGEDGGKEMPDVRGILARFQKPFFAVPGNHDGYAGFGGLLNVLIDELGNLTRVGLNPIDRDWGRSAASGIKSINKYVPTLVAWRLLSRLPRYDGLGEFQNYLGPLNVGFKFRGHSFIGVNSYDLTAGERAAMGGIVINWGGALQDDSVVWLENMLNLLSPDSKQHGQVVFMHHDPRGAVPQHSSFRERFFGIYDPTDSYISKYTFGHLGIGNSPETGLYWPLLTPLTSYLARSVDIAWGDDAGAWQQEWMRKIDMPSFFDETVYNARGLIELVNCNLSGRSAGDAPWQGDEARCSNPKGWVSHLAFAHNNIPLEELWVDATQRGAVFREPETPEWWDRPFSNLSYLGQVMGGKYRNGSPPRWAQGMRLGDGHGNAKVLRLDDVGQIGEYHGFHLITLYSDGRQEIEWKALPR